MAQKILVEFQESDDYQLFPTAGVWGGVSPQGDVIAKFFVEEFKDPARMLLEVAGETARELSRDGDRDAEGNPVVVRRLQTGVVLRADIARSIGQWLLQKSDEALARARVSEEPGASH